MKNSKTRFGRGISYLVIGLSFTIFLFSSVLSLDYERRWIYILLISAMIFVSIEGALWLASSVNRKKHEEYMNNNFNLDKIQKLDSDLVILDKLIKWVPNCYIIFSAIVVFVEYGFNYSTVLVMLYFVFCYWKR